jgi:hypothetical protein
LTPAGSILSWLEMKLAVGTDALGTVPIADAGEHIFGHNSSISSWARDLQTGYVALESF